VLIGTRGISARDAYEQLRAQARTERRKLAAICADVVENASRPAVGEARPRQVRE
jgi:AmiR/NasT family two-component response regulator